MGIRLQEFIHKFEVGPGSRYARMLLGLVAMIGIAALYDVVAFTNLSVREGIDAVQVGQNLAEGRGFSTRFIRPLSLHLIQRRQQPETINSSTSEPPPTNAVPVALTLPHPDLENPPLYPLSLAVALKLMPFGEPTQAKVTEVNKPDLWVALLNQLFLVLSAVVLFLIGARLFDETAGWLGAGLFVGSDLLWRFSLSGLSTMLLILLFLLLVWVLTRLEEAVRQDDQSKRPLVWSAVAGVLVGLGGMTRYGYAFTILPVMILILTWRKGKLGHLALAALGSCLLIMSPWIARNLVVSGTLFGTAGYAVYEDTVHYPGDLLPRTLQPDLRDVSLAQVRQKVFVQLRQVVEKELPQLGGSWVVAFFLVGLLMPFRSPALKQLRRFLLMALAMFAVVQAFGRAPPSTGNLNPHSLVVLATPLIFLFGASFFLVLVDQTGLQFPPGRYIAIGGFWLVMVMPFILTLCVPPASPVMFPPYYAPWIREKSHRTAAQDVIMSDIPWAVAWYGNRPSVWLSLAYRNDEQRRFRNDFYAVDRILPVKALYLSADFMKSIPGQTLYEWRLADPELDAFVRLRSQLGANWAGGQKPTEPDTEALAAFRELLLQSWGVGKRGDEDWGSFVTGALIKREVPTGFPLSNAYEGDRLYPELFLMESERNREKAIQSR